MASFDILREETDEQDQRNIKSAWYFDKELVEGDQESMAEEKFDQFLCLIEELELEEYLPALIENGFDNWEALEDLTGELLVQCGICDDNVKIQQIIACVKGAESYDFKKAKRQDGQLSLTPSTQTASQQELRRPNEVSLNDILKSTNKKREKGVSDARFLAGLFVLSIPDKKFKFIGKELTMCSNLSTLQLFSNSIELIDNLHNCSRLTAVQLDNNMLTRISGLENLRFLEKLNLNKNRISRLEGLENLVSLRELQVSHQQNEGKNFTFDEESLRAIGGTLEVLECENSNISQINAFVHLEQLRNLKIGGNQILKFDDFLEPLSAMRRLENLTAKGNPVASVQKYRDRMVLMSTQNLETLDDKKILPKERQFLLNLWKMKHGMKVEGKEDGVMKTNSMNQMRQESSKTLASVEGKMISPMMTDDQVFKNPQSYQKLNVANDVRGNQTIQSTKHVHGNNQWTGR